VLAITLFVSCAAQRHPSTKRRPRVFRLVRFPGITIFKGTLRCGQYDMTLVVRNFDLVKPTNPER